MTIHEVLAEIAPALPLIGATFKRASKLKIEAGHPLRHAAQAMLTEVDRYHHAIDAQKVFNGDDWSKTFMWAVEIIRASDNLGGTRKLVVAWRLKRIVGDFVGTLASTARPETIKDASHQAVAPLFWYLSGPVERRKGTLLDKAMAGPRTSREITRLRAELTKLAAGR